MCVGDGEREERERKKGIQMTLMHSELQWKIVLLNFPCEARASFDANGKKAASTKNEYENERATASYLWSGFLLSDDSVFDFYRY